MKTWSAEELRHIGAAEELQVASRRADGSLRRWVTIWVVRVGDDIFVRSAFGPDNPWYVRALASGTGRIRAGGVEADVIFAETAPEANSDIDLAYHRKYDRHGPEIVGTVVGEHAWKTSIRLVPGGS